MKRRIRILLVTIPILALAVIGCLFTVTVVSHSPDERLAIRLGLDCGRLESQARDHDYSSDFEDKGMVWVYLAYNVRHDGTQDPRQLDLLARLERLPRKQSDNLCQAFAKSYRDGYHSNPLLVSIERFLVR